MPLATSFGQFRVLTRERSVADPKVVLNEISLQNYLFSRLMRGRRPSDLAGWGTKLTDKIKVEEMGSSGAYSPGEKITFTRRQTARSTEVVIRHVRTSGFYTDAEAMQQGPSRESAFSNFSENFSADLKSDHHKTLETYLWQRPDCNEMETQSADPGLPYSIPALICENVTSPSTTGYMPPLWGAITATIMGLSPITYSAWRNQRRTYDHTQPSSDTNGIIHALQMIELDTEFKGPKRGGPGFKDSTFATAIIVTTKAGRGLYSDMVRIANDQTRTGPQDPAYSDPQFSGVPVEWSAELGSALLDESAGVYSGTAYPDTKPRYFVIQPEFLFPSFDSQMVMKESNPIPFGAERPDADAEFITSWYNLRCRSRRRQGIVCPAA